jgi:hypothetical protein
MNNLDHHDAVKPAGRLRHRPSGPHAGRWCIGCETVDRDFVSFEAMEPFLQQVGAAEVRLQGGWARCEPNADGRYEWAWLDRCIDGAIDAGLKPWLQLSYGNPAYPQGGGVGLRQGLPTSDEAVAGFVRWSVAAAERYGDRIHAFEIWNEADLRGGDPLEYATLLAAVGPKLREARPDVKQYAFSVAHMEPAWLRTCLEAAQQAGPIDFIDAVLFHGYPGNPDDEFDLPLALEAEARRFLPDVEMIQGETGSPAAKTTRALSHLDWTPRAQAVWNSRRMLAHHARGYAMNLFQISDMQYFGPAAGESQGANTKGLIETRRDNSAVGPRPSFDATRSIFTLFGSDVALGAQPYATEDGVACFAWSGANEDAIRRIAWWRNDTTPAEGEALPKTIRLPRPPFAQPRIVDILSGGDVYELDPRDDEIELPCLDTPLVCVDAADVSLG